MDKQKTIAVMTSGGDAPGMNAVIRAVVRTAIYHGYKVMGIERGYSGLLKGEIRELVFTSVSDIINKGGTILKTARSKSFQCEDGFKKAKNMLEIFKIDALVVIGGDGSFRGAKALSELGVSVIGIPGTIDNDISCTEYTIGYDTALNTVVDAIDKIRDTAYSHERCSVIEVMGRESGHIALTVGIAGGAEAVILPEKEFDFSQEVLKPIIECRNRGKENFLVILAEGVGGAIELANKISETVGIEARATILGHIQRGGKPTAQDRYYGGLMGSKAIEVLKEGRENRIIAVQENKIVDIDIVEALNMTKGLDEKSIEINKILSL